ncbi:hypothetical protein FA15DRAFT_699424 [Coprinopsis marcescibilis]|uniref:FUN14-domain-containing protein n=1 Tax=Coprinopsis marcescibilis TaxID=230819 RepID=A0A5C3LBP0_COPMA|nr:hypothetical protein FA15DRAFT_699424 [Coprinopsis marcescibilis]
MVVPLNALARNLVSSHASGTLCRATFRQPWNGFAAVQLGLRHSHFPTQVLRQAAKSVKAKQGNALYKSAAIATVGLGLSMWQSQSVKCDASTPTIRSEYWEPHIVNSKADELPEPPKSSVSMYELGFGTVAGICAGVFVKKGAKAAAWLLGGVFVLLQYFASQSFIRVDWARMASRFESAFHSADPQSGLKRAPTVGSVFKRLIDFLTADFQPRASFVAGFALGLRIG